MKRIPVLLADPQPIVRAGWRALLDLQPDLETIGEADTGREAVLLAGRMRPAVVVMDLSMALLNGLESTRQILGLGCEIKVLVLSSHSDESCRALAAKFGASGFLLKEDASRSLPEAIRRIHRGAAFLSPALSGRQDPQPRWRVGGGQCVHETRKSLLTSREMEVLQLIAEGMSNRGVAVELQISTKTVVKHRQVLMEKLDVHGAAGLTRYAIAWGIIDCGLQLYQI